MIDYTKLRIEDIKRLLVEEGHYTSEQLDEADLKGKSAWVQLHKQANGVEEAPAFVFEEPESVAVNEQPTASKEAVVKKTPGYSDPEWQEYVLSLFADNEYVEIDNNKYPTVNGLRRVVELLLGEIVKSGPIDVQTTLHDDPGKAVVQYEIVIEWKLGAGPYIDLANDAQYLPTKVFRAVASSWHGNTDDKFAVFPEAIAETRAEGRALRRALRLGIVCADELTRKDTASIVKAKVAQAEKPTEGNWDENAPITDNQINSIKFICERLGIDVAKFINSGSKQYAAIEEISKQTAANMLKRLNQFQSTTGNVEVPLELLLEK